MGEDRIEYLERTLNELTERVAELEGLLEKVHRGWLAGREIDDAILKVMPELRDE